MSEIERTSIYLHSQASTFDNGTVKAILSAFEVAPTFVPTHWGADERVKKAYKREDVLGAVRNLKPPVGGAINLYREKVVKYGGYFGVTQQAFLSFDFHKSTTAARLPEVFALSDALAGVCHPRFGTVHIFRPSKDSWKSERDRLEDWMEYCAYDTPGDFKPNGPLGLGMRTYFGGDILDLFGRDLLLKTPAVVKELDWGGICIDLTDDVWNAKPEMIIAAWQKAMAHLDKAKAFAVPRFDERQAYISFSPSPAWQKRAKS